ncbi:MAG: hypothetical protein FNT15_10000 [Sulfurovum sp.]|nr:MAG: hypothetical protein FNT15_10000 [Sulfurovum sp.]
MIYQLTFSAYAYTSINKDNLKKNILMDFELEYYERSDLYVISFMHPCNLSYGDYYHSEYEPWYVKMVEQYGDYLKEIGFSDFEILINIFSIKDENNEFPQCNFEIFNSTLLTKISHYSVALPISIYAISIEEAMDFLKMSKNEIELEFFYL